MIRTAFREEEHFEVWSDACARLTDLDRFCSSPYWGVPLCKAFQYGGKLYCYQRSDEEVAFFYERAVKGGVMVIPADGMWLLGCPLLSAKPKQMLMDLARYWQDNPPAEGIRQTLISGIYPHTELYDSRFWAGVRGWESDKAGRMVASLEGGFDGFMSRRSKNFRSRLRRTVKQSKAEGMEPEMMPKQCGPEESRALLKRIMAVEGQSWKGLCHRGINEGGMREFYEHMIPLLARDGRLRGLFLTREGKDLAYLFGGVFSNYFRGLQFSYVEDQSLGLGNVCQYYALRSLAEEGCTHYDLGQSMDYKKRWAENHIDSKTFVFQVG